MSLQKKMLLGFILIVQVVAAQKEYIRVKFGNWNVGFQSHFVLDYSRPSRTIDEKGRLLQINVWYPSLPGSGKERMDYAKYISLSNIQDNWRGWRNTREAINEYLKAPLAEGADSVSWKSFIFSARQMLAFKNAQPAKAQFPLVFLIHGSTADYSLMAEYLASKGMIVVNVPIKGYSQHDLEVNAVGMETQIRDNEFALQFLQEHYKINPTKAAVIGMSFGGQSALGMAIRNSLIKCVVSLDGGIGSNFGGQLLSGSHFYKTESITIPILHLYNPDDPGTNLHWFDDYKYADRFLVGFKNMIHSYFLSYGHLSNSISNILGRKSPVADMNYEAILAYCGQFIEEAFATKFDASKIISLPASENWIAKILSQSVYKEAIPAPIHLSHLNDMYKQGGISGIEESRMLGKQKSNRPITVDSYRNLFQFILNRRDSIGLVRIGELLEIDYPDTFIACYYRGRSLQLTGRPAEGIVYIRKASELLTGDLYLSAVEKEAFKNRIIELLE